MDRPRVVRVLRIAVTVLSLTACVLLSALWVRSYSWKEAMYGPVSATRSFIVESVRGRINVYSFEDSTALPWGVERSRWDTQRFGIDMMHGFLLGLPHWLLAFIAGTVSVAPLVGRWRFGPAILALVFALVSVMWGLIVAFVG